MYEADDAGADDHEECYDGGVSKQCFPRDLLNKNLLILSGSGFVPGKWCKVTYQDSIFVLLILSIAFATVDSRANGHEYCLSLRLLG